MVYLQFQDAAGAWVTYDEKYVPTSGGTDSVMLQAKPPFIVGDIKNVGFDGSIDPRTPRFNVFNPNAFNSNRWLRFPPYGGDTRVSSSSGWLDAANGVLASVRPDQAGGGIFWGNNELSGLWLYPPTIGWYPGNFKNGSVGAGFLLGDNGSRGLRPGLLSQNGTTTTNSGTVTSTGTEIAGTATQFYTDADGVVRRAMAGFASALTGLPTATGNTISGGTATRIAQSSSRPIILNRPFRAVSELSYTFSGTPWKNVSFFTPESGDAALLDVFCVNETDDPRGLVAGKVNLNTRQVPVLQAILAGAYQDEWNAGGTTLTTANAGSLAAALVARTTGTTVNGQAPPSGSAQPLGNLSELVGKWVASQTTNVSGAAAPNNVDGSASYSGFIGDSNVSTILGANNVIQRYRESAIRSLASAGQTRVWNLMIDVVAQTGRYPQSASSAANPLAAFVVEGEQRYWVHVAIDRLTGQVIDKQIEVVKE